MCLSYFVFPSMSSNVVLISVLMRERVLKTKYTGYTYCFLPLAWDFFPLYYQTQWQHRNLYLELSKPVYGMKLLQCYFTVTVKVKTFWDIFDTIFIFEIIFNTQRMLPLQYQCNHVKLMVGFIFWNSFRKNMMLLANIFF